MYYDPSLSIRLENEKITIMIINGLSVISKCKRLKSFDRGKMCDKTAY